MTYWLIGAAVLVLLGLLMAAMVRAWRARGRRQSEVPAPERAPDELGPASVERDGFYVATTRAGDPLDRIVVHGLGFRGRAVVSVHPEGVRLAIAGEPAVLIRASSVRAVERATWAIDRVVETDGLVAVTWSLGDTVVDTYLRFADDPRPVVDALRPLVPPAPAAGTPTGEKTID
ncbi:hypothetical protein [Frigoribacterium endophyticum]|uniref:PH-like domain-containing protein n=1 Tax=Frigoribacterium endophyticum TaxID=1522176 RepID=UPI001ABABF95|nr:hypothetical protein [Frigoribacterium endophyticum]